MSGKYGASFCIIYCKTTFRFLVEHRGKNVGNPLTYGFFGGGIDKGETPIKAMCRELREETGMKVSVFDYAVRVNEKKPVFMFVKILDDEFEPVLSWESKGFRWISDIDEVKPLQSMLVKNYGKIRRMMEATRNACIEESMNNAK